MTDHPNATDWRNRAEAAEQRCAEVGAERDALRSHADALAEALGDCCPEMGRAFADPVGLKDSIVLMDDFARAMDRGRSTLANYSAWLIDGGGEVSKPYDEPAFPLPDAGAYQFGGMSLRDWFAGQIAAALSSAADSTGMWTGLIDDESGYRLVAERSYRMADALLTERSKP